MDFRSKEEIIQELSKYLKDKLQQNPELLNNLDDKTINIVREYKNSKELSYQKAWSKVRSLESEKRFLEDECKSLKHCISKVKLTYLILTIFFNFIYCGICNHFINKSEKLENQNKLYRVQIEELNYKLNHNKFPNWYTSAFNKCNSNQVPKNFIKSCIIYELER